MTAQEIITTPAQTTDLRDVYEPTNTADAYKLATWLAKSNMLGSGIKTPEQALTVMITGRELGLRSMQALRGIHVIEGKPTLSADLISALCLRSPECEYFQCVNTSATTCTYETKRKGWPQPTTITWTIEQAQRAGLTTKQNWQKFPDAMLRARCITALARMVYPDLFAGVYDPDEMDRTPTPRDVTVDAKVIDMPVREVESAPETQARPDVAEAAREVFGEDAELKASTQLVQTAAKLFASTRASLGNERWPVVSKHGWMKGVNMSKWLGDQSSDVLQQIIDELQALEEAQQRAIAEQVDPASTADIPW